MKKCSSFQAGFTLVELLVVIGIFGLLVYFTLTSNVTHLFRKNEVSSTAMSLHSALNYARNASIDRGRKVTFCTPNDTATACSVTPNWGKGWMVISPDNNGNDDIRVFPSKFGNLPNNSIVNVNNTPLLFSNGSVNQSTTFILCNKEGMGGNAREVIVSMTGRIRTVAGNDPTATHATCSGL